MGMFNSSAKGLNFTVPQVKLLFAVDLQQFQSVMTSDTCSYAARMSLDSFWSFTVRERRLLNTLMVTLNVTRNSKLTS